MRKIRYLLVLTSVIAFLLAIIVEYSSLLSPNADYYANKLEKHLDNQRQQLTKLVEDADFFERLIYQTKEVVATTQEEDYAKLNQLAKKVYTIHIYKGDSLAFWSNNQVSFDKNTYDANPVKNSSYRRLGNGHYEIWDRRIQLNNEGFDFIAFIPIQYDYKLESSYLNASFTLPMKLPEELKVTDQTSEYVVKTDNENVLCYLNSERPLSHPKKTKWSFFFYLIGFLALGILIDQFAKQLIKEKALWVGTSFLVCSIFGLQLLSSLTGFTARFSSIEVFERAPESFLLSNSLGDLLINIILLLWVILFFHRHYKIPSYNHLSKSNRIGLTFLQSFAIVLALCNVGFVMKGLMLHSNIPFDFDNLFNFTSTGLLAISGVIFLLAALFLFSHLMMMMILQINLTRSTRVMAYGASILSAVFLSSFYQLNLPIPQLLLFSVLYIALFDLFVDNEVNNLTWLVIWLVILASLASSLLYKYYTDKEVAKQHDYVVQLAETRDTIAEYDLWQLKQALEKEDLFREIETPYHFEIKDDSPIRKRIDMHFSALKYLFNNYDYSYSIINQEGKSLLANQKVNDQTFKAIWDNSTSTPFEHIHYTDKTGKLVHYHLYLETLINGEADNKALFLIDFYHKNKRQSKVYSELLRRQPYRGLEGLQDYDYAIYSNGELVDRSGDGFKEKLDVKEYPLPAAGSVREQRYEGNLTELIYHVAATEQKAEKVIILQKDDGGILKPISLFSYIFALLIFFIFLTGILNIFIPILPNTLNFSIIRKPSLRNRIQLSVISLTVLSFIVIGVVTGVYFRNSSNDYHENRLDRKTDSVIRDVEHELDLLVKDSLNIADLDLRAISNIHRLDINFYDTKGKLVKSSEIDIFRKNIISKEMHRLAFQELSHSTSNRFVTDEEHIGELNYKAAYVPLHIRKNEKLGYLGLPYYSQQTNLREDVTVFMGTLLNVYVFLLLIAGAIAIAVANSITKPIAVIGDRLKQFKLGGRNAKLEWKSQDELGELIDEYNAMVQKIEESAELLAQSEREGAWREMAKQVAHEIKNPLTPMKLSIQYLRHAFRSNSDDIEALLKRVTNTLIEQIDNLAQIASEFSNFAKMPRAENQKIELNHLVEGVYDLFKEHRDKNVSLEIPPHAYYVYADKNHLMRVFTNLVKNAVQAIPEDREGNIKIKVFEDAHNVIVQVKDNGTGISDEMKEKVFVPNFTTKNSGTGLGLAISKNIIESVNGDIYFDTEVGIGTSFFVKLPIIEVKELEEVM